MSLETDIQSLTMAVQDLIFVMKLPLMTGKGETLKIEVKKDHKEVNNTQVESTDKTLDDVKSAILNLASKKGRNASLDVLAKFGIVSGEGKDRKGSVMDLKEEQYADCVKEAIESAL